MIFYTEDKYYVTINGTNDNTIKPGFELLSINGERIEMVRTKMLKYLWADGYNETGKTKATSEAYFPLFYYLFIARPESFNLVFKNLNGEEVKIVVPAQPFKETQKFFSKNPVNESILKIYGPKNKLDRKKGWRLQVLKKVDVAIMRINGFGGGKSEEEARGIMRHFLDGCMAKLEKDKIRNLIIDLRYNSGGWDIQGVELFTYLIKEPTRCYRRLHSVSDSSEFLKFSDLSSEDMKNVQNELKKEADGTFSIKEEFSPQLKLQSPKPNRFTGNILVLANGGSASTTSEFVAYTKSNKSAIIIGEETGGAYEGGNGGSYIHLELPNSKINVATPLLYYDNEVTEPIQKGRGTMPDFEVHSSLEEVLKGYDRPLNFALEFIKKQNIK